MGQVPFVDSQTEIWSGVDGLASKLEEKKAKIRMDEWEVLKVSPSAAKFCF